MAPLSVYVLMALGLVGGSFGMVNEADLCPDQLCLNEFKTCPTPNYRFGVPAKQLFHNGVYCDCFCGLPKGSACESNRSCEIGTVCGLPARSTGKNPKCLSACDFVNVGHYQKCVVDSEGRAVLIPWAPLKCNEDKDFLIKAFNEFEETSFKSMCHWAQANAVPGITPETEWILF